MKQRVGDHSPARFLCKHILIRYFTPFVIHVTLIISNRY